MATVVDEMMMETEAAVAAPPAEQPQTEQPLVGSEPGTYVIGDFQTFGQEGATWVQAGFVTSNSDFYAYADENAVVEGSPDKLTMTANPYSHTNDLLQVLDNAKQMLFSAQPVAVPDGGTITFEFEMAATGYNTTPGDLRDGFASFNALDFGTGLALDFFTSNDRMAAIYARLGFPQMKGIVYDLKNRAPKLRTFILRTFFLYFEHRRIDQKRSRLYRLLRNIAWQRKQDKFFAIFKETAKVTTTPGQKHKYSLFYDQGNDRIEWWIDGKLIYAVEDVRFKARSFTLAYGLMTEKDMGKHGSVSLHGQGMRGEYSTITVTTTR